jgi:hypothetical protein
MAFTRETTFQRVWDGFWLLSQLATLPHGLRRKSGERNLPAIAFTLRRLNEDHRATLGELLDADGRHLCHVLENRWMDNKPRVSCIPPGIYPLRLRKEGGWHERLKARFPGIHKGAIELANVPGRTFILIHPGNTHKDTLGCILPGKAAQWPERVVDPSADPKARMHAVERSTEAYSGIYRALLAAANWNQSIQVLDLSHRSRAGTIT